MGLQPPPQSSPKHVPLHEYIVEQWSGHKPALKIRGRRYKAGWLKQRSRCSRRSCKNRLWLMTAINMAAKMGDAVAEAAWAGAQGSEYCPLAMWCHLFAALVVIHRVVIHTGNLMRNGNAIQHYWGWGMSLCTVSAMRNGNTMQSVYGDCVNFLLSGVY